MVPQPKAVETLSHTKLQDKRENGSPGTFTLLPKWKFTEVTFIYFKIFW